MPGKIFLSYTRSDIATVEPYIEAFREALDHWIDREEIEPGSDFIERINEGLRACPNAIIFDLGLLRGEPLHPEGDERVDEWPRSTIGVLYAGPRPDRRDAVARLLAPLASWVWAGNPRDLVRVFSGRSPEDAHPASLAVGLSLPGPPPIDVFLQQLAVALDRTTRRGLPRSSRSGRPPGPRDVLFGRHKPLPAHVPRGRPAERDDRRRHEVPVEHMLP